MNKKFGTSIILALVLVAALTSVMSAQELTPRAYWPAPKGTIVAVFGYAYSSGDVFMDPSIPLYGVDSKIHTAIAAYLQTIRLWGRSANLVVELPHVHPPVHGRGRSAQRQGGCERQGGEPGPARRVAVMRRRQRYGPRSLCDRIPGGVGNASNI